MPAPRSTDQHVLPPRPRGVPATRWVYDAFRSAIIEGRLRAGAKVASTRRLARQLGLARGTIVAAFDALQAEGTWSAGRAPASSSADVRPAVDDAPLVREAPRPPGGPRRRWSRLVTRVRRFERFGTPGSRAFRTHQPALDLFPTALWARVMGRRVRRATVQDLAG